MVRLKQRYLLFEVLYPPQGNAADREFSLSPKNAFLSVHKSSPASINPKTITNTIKSTIQQYYGDHGASFSMSLNIKYFNNKTSCGIIRCGRQNFQYVAASLALITEISGQPVIIKCSRASGTIKKSEEFAIQQNRVDMMRLASYEKAESPSVL